MDNFEKENLTEQPEKQSDPKDLSEESRGALPDEATVPENQELKPDTPDDDKTSEDVQDPTDSAAGAQDSTDSVEEAQDPTDSATDAQDSTDSVEAQDPTDSATDAQDSTDSVEAAHEPDDSTQDAQDPVAGGKDEPDSVDSVEDAKDPADSGVETQHPVESAEDVKDPDGDEQAAIDPDDDMESLMDLYEESFKRFEEGEVVTGKIISVDKEHVLVDIGYKSEGQIRISEFIDEDGNLNANVGDSVDVMVEWWDDEEERVILSKEKAAKVKVWEEIKKSYDDDATVEGVILNRVKGGFSVDIGVQAFLPGSQADLRPIRNLDEMVGETFDFKILKYNRKRSNIVLSRRVILEEERESKRAATLSAIQEDKVVQGVVKNITEYGVFVDLGGVDGLLHITDISWGRVKHPSELFSVGDEISVKILNLDIERERVSLGMKQLAQDPWLTAAEKYPVGSRIQGKIVSLTDYGAFVELEEGIEGLIHVSEMSWTRKVRHPSKVVSVGEIVEAVVLDIRPENRRISLGMKQVVPNPWDVISEKYPVGTTIEGKIKNITDFGLFIGIDEGIDGLVHISDISWTKRIKHPSELFKKGDVIQAIVLDIEKEHERFSLGVKQLQSDPWQTVAERYEVGKEITGTVTNLTDFGVFVELEEGIEGLVHVSEISKEKIKTPVGKFNIGDVITAKVMNINSEERRIGLSIKRLEIEDEQSLLSEYVNNIRPATSTFGEILRENLQEKLSEE